MTGVGRMLLCVDPSRVTVEIIDTSAQWIHVRATFLDSSTSCLVTFVYGLNDVPQRRVLWDFVCAASREYRDTPWCVVGDMIVMRKPNERAGGDLTWYDGDGELDIIMHEPELEDLRSTGAFFT